MIKKFALLIPLFLFMVLGFFLWKGLNNDPHHIPSSLIDKPVPKFKAQNLLPTGKRLSQRIFTGHFSLLNVFASWCGYCLAEHSVIMDIAKKYAVKVYGLNYKDKRKNALAWLNKHGNPFLQVIFDPQGELGIELGVYGTPETYLIDPKGIIRYKQVGPLSYKTFFDEIYPLIKGEKING